MKRVIAATRSQDDVVSGALFYLSEAISELEKLSSETDDAFVRSEAYESFKLVEKARARMDRANAYLYKLERGMI